MVVPAEWPSRFLNLPAARLRFGDRVDRLGPFFLVGDALADEVVSALAPLDRHARESLVDRVLKEGIAAVPEAPDALHRLFAQLDRVPFWVDFERASVGGAAFLSSSWFGAMVLATQSLVLAYCSPGGNKPLTFSGRLVEDAQRRLAETSRFVQAASLPNGLRRGGDGFASMVRVRLIHAQVRRFLRNSPRWDAAAWGTPIDQVDMGVTVQLFSSVVLDGLRKLGFALLPEESDGLVHLWRYAGYLLGVDEQLLCTTENEARNYCELVECTQGPPDDDSRALVAALLESPLRSARSDEQREKARRLVDFSKATARHLVGPRYAEELALPNNSWRHVFSALPHLVRVVDHAVRQFPASARLQRAVGERYWKQVVDLGLAGLPASFAMPDRLANLAPV